jgi:translation elongation factor P/translation initiation factor 5A
MKIYASEIRVGMLIEYKDDLWQVLKTQHVKPGKGGAFAQVEMKSVNKNTKLNERFRSSESVEKASLMKLNLIFFIVMKLIIILWIQNLMNKLILKKILLEKKVKY